jgi:hypothetical protein
MCQWPRFHKVQVIERDVLFHDNVAHWDNPWVGYLTKSDIDSKDKDAEVKMRRTWESWD